MLEASVDGFRGSLAGVGVVEVGEDFPGSAFECSSQCDDLPAGARDARVAETVYFGLYLGLTGGGWVFRTICFDRAILSSPGRLRAGRTYNHEEVLEAHA